MKLQTTLLGILACLQTGLGMTTPDLTVARIEISGNEALRDTEIQAVMRSREPQLFIKSDFDRRILRLDAISIKTLYQSRGYLEASVKDSFAVTDNRVTVYLSIHEGRQYFLKQLNIQGNEVLKAGKIGDILGFKTGKPYDPVNANTNIPLLEEKYQKKGKLFATVRIQDRIGDSVIVDIKINEGPDVYINKFFVEGIQNLDTSIVSREFLFHSGDLYRKDQIDLTKRRLLQTGLFSLVTIEPTVSALADSLVNVVVEVRQFKPRELSSEGGLYPIDFIETPEPIPAVGAELEWRNRSLFRSPTRFSARLMAHMPMEKEFVYQYPRLSVDMTLSSPWLLGYRVPTRIRAFYETYMDYTTFTVRGIPRYGLVIANTYQFNDRSFIESGLDWETFHEVEDTVSSPHPSIEQRSIHFRSRLDKADDPLFPSRGYVLTGEFKSAGGLLGGDRNFIKLDVGIQGYHTLVHKVVLAGRIKAGQIWKWDSNYVDVRYDKYYLGGSTSLRAWEVLRFKQIKDEQGKEVPYGDVVRVMTNWELRFPLIWLFGAELFVDGGQLTGTFSKVSLSSMQWDAGAGLTMDTPFGPVRLDYAVRLKDLNVGTIQLGIQYIF